MYEESEITSADEASPPTALDGAPNAPDGAAEVPRRLSKKFDVTRPKRPPDFFRVSRN